MTDDSIRIELTFGGDGVVDVSHLLKASSLTLAEPAFNDDRRSILGTASWTLLYDGDLFARIVGATSPIQVRIWHGEFLDLIFDGQMDPVASTGWIEPDKCDPISCEAVDFSVGLDKRIAQSISFPAVVDGPPFYIYKRDDPEISILYRLLELAGLSDRIAKDAPDIPQLVRHFAATKGEETYRDLIDGLLADYLYCLTVRDCRLTWVPTAAKEIGPVPHIGMGDILASGRTSFARRYDAHDGVAVTWPRTKVYDDALLWRGNLPVGDTSDPTPGEAIAGGDYWPEDSDIIETWQDFGTEFLDIDYLSGKNRLKNGDIGLITSSDQYVRDSKDETVALDPIDADHAVIYEALRARVRYKNTGSSAAKLYWSEIYGKALVRTQRVVATYPETAADPEEYVCSHIYDKDSADRLVQGRYMLLRVGCFYLEFTSRSNLVPGGIYYLKQGRIEDYVQVRSRFRTYDGTGRYRYQVVRTAPFAEVQVGSITHQGSGTQRPGQDAKVLSLSLTATQFSFNADGMAKEQDDIIASVSQQGIGQAIRLFVNGTEVVTSLGQYVITPAMMNGRNFIQVRATCGDKVQENVITKVMDGATGAPGKDGDSGQAGASLVLDLSRTQVECYADDVPKDSSAIVVTVASAGFDEAPKLYVDGTLVTLTSANQYNVPVNTLSGKNTVAVKAVVGQYSQTATISKIIDAGSLILDVSKETVPFYADDVPYAQGAVVVTVSSSGFSAPPTLTKDGAAVALTDGKYTMEASAFVGVDNVVFVAETPTLRRQATVSKRMDAGTISLELSRDTFRYYADGPQHAGQDPVMATLSYAGFSKAPTLTVKGVEVAPVSGSYSIPQSIMGDAQTVEVKAAIASYSVKKTIGRAVDQGRIFLSLNAHAFRYYADNAAYTQDNITATVERQGLYHAPKLTVGGTAYVLDSEGRASIPATVVASVDSVEVRAYSERLPSISQTAIISKQRDVPTLLLSATGTQFSYDKDGALKGPSAIILSYRLTGASDTVVPVLKIANAAKEWESGQYAVPASMMDGRQFIECVATVESLSLSSTVILTKTQDGEPGDPGQPGATGNGISSIANYYLASASGSGVTNASSGFTTAIQTVTVTLKYLWNYELVTYTDGSTSKSPACIIGVYGDKGDAGADGANAGGEYLGKGDIASPPTTRLDGTPVQHNDYFLSVANERNPVPYIRTGADQWQAVGKDDPRWTYIAAATSGDVASLGSTLLATSAYYGYFGNLAANNAAIETLGTKRVTLMADGEIVSEDYYSSGMAEGMRVGADGNVDFTNGTWRGDIASGMLRAVNGSVDKDGVDAFAYSQAMTKGQVFDRFVKAHIGTNVYGMDLGSQNVDSGDLNHVAAVKKVDEKSFNAIAYFDRINAPGYSATDGFTCERVFNCGKGMYIIQGQYGNVNTKSFLLVTYEMVKLASTTDTFDMSCAAATVDITSQLGAASIHNIALCAYDDIHQYCYIVRHDNSVYRSVVNGTSMSFSRVGTLSDADVIKNAFSPSVSKVYEPSAKRYRYVVPYNATIGSSGGIAYSYDMVSWTLTAVDETGTGFIPYVAATMKGSYFYTVMMTADGSYYLGRVSSSGAITSLYRLTGDTTVPVTGIVSFAAGVYASRNDGFVYAWVACGYPVSGIASVSIKCRWIRYSVEDGIATELSVPEPKVDVRLLSIMTEAMHMPGNDVQSCPLSMGYDAVHDRDVLISTISIGGTLGCGAVHLMEPDGRYLSELCPNMLNYTPLCMGDLQYAMDMSVASDSAGTWLNVPVSTGLDGADSGRRVPFFCGWVNMMDCRPSFLGENIATVMPLVYPAAQYVRRDSEDEFVISIYGYYTSVPMYFPRNIGHFRIIKGSAAPCPVEGVLTADRKLVFTAQDAVPFEVASSRMVQGLNADLLDGKHAADIVGDATTAASGYATQAQASAQQAASSASSAFTSKTAAASSASAAASSAAAANTSQTAAASSASAANTSETNAASSKTAAANSASAAASSAAAANTSKTAAANSASAAAASATAAQTAANSIPTLAAMVDLIYPVGSVLQIENTTFNPNDRYPGTTWTRVSGVFLFASDGTNDGETGGEATHTLTIAEMPAHTHKYNNPNEYAEWDAHGYTGRACAAPSMDSGSTGGGQPHNNMPPFRKVSMWRRTA